MTRYSIVLFLSIHAMIVWNVCFGMDKEKDSEVTTMSMDDFLKDDSAGKEPEGTSEAMEELNRLFHDGLISREEYDRGHERLTTIQIAIDHSLEGDDLRSYETITCVESGKELRVPTALRDEERPHVADKRSSADWESSVESTWCQQSDEGTESKFSAIGLTHQETKCAICENFMHRIVWGGVADMGTCPAIDARVNVFGLVQCNMYKDQEHETPSPLPSGLFGSVQFESGATFHTLCEQFRREFAGRMSAREVSAWESATKKQVLLEWEEYDVLKEEGRCFHHIIDDLVSRMCSDAMCCDRKLTQGCPHHALMCDTCVELVEPTVKAKREPRKIDFASIDADLTDFYVSWLREDSTRIVAEVEALREERELIDSYLFGFKEYLRPKFGLVLSKLHPALDCLAIRKAVNREITRLARTTSPRCLEPKEYEWNRNVFARARGRPNCLHVYRESLKKDSGAADATAVCRSVLSNTISSVLRLKDVHKEPSIDAWIAENVKFLPPSARPSKEMIADMASQCCVVVVGKWIAGDDAKTAATLHEKERAFDAQRVAAETIRHYQDVTAELHRSAHRDDRSPTNRLMKEDPTAYVPTVESLRELYEGAMQEFEPFFDRLESIETETERLVRLQFYQKAREIHIAGDGELYMPSKKLWHLIKTKLSERAAQQQKTDDGASQTSSLGDARTTRKGRLGWFKAKGASSKAVVKLQKDFWDTYDGGGPRELCGELFDGLCGLKD